MTTNGVSFRHTLATAVCKTRKHFLVQMWDIYWGVLCRRTKRVNIFSLWQPQTLFQAVNWNFIQKTHWLWDEGTRGAKMLTDFRVLGLITSPHYVLTGTVGRSFNTDWLNGMLLIVGQSAACNLQIVTALTNFFQRTKTLLYPNLMKLWMWYYEL